MTLDPDADREARAATELEIDDELRLARSSDADGELAGVGADRLSDPSDTLRYESELRSLRDAEHAMDDEDRR